MPQTKPTPLSEWLHLHSVSISDLAKEIGVTRQTIARIARHEFEKVDVQTMQAIVSRTGLTWESLCHGEPENSNRRTGIPIIDYVIPNLVRDLSLQDTVRRYKKYISPRFTCSSPHYFQTARGRMGELWGIEEGDTVNGEVIDYSEGFIDWKTMCRYNLPDMDQAQQYERYTTVESIDIVGKPGDRDISKELLVVTKSVWHRPNQTYNMPQTLCRLTLESPAVTASKEIPPRIVSWWWIELSHSP